MSSSPRGKTIAVIGAGPAGATAAALLARSGRNKVLLFDQRSLIEPPAAGTKPFLCGGCGGLIQAGVLRRLKSLGLALPPQIVQDELAGYVVHFPKRHATFEIAEPGMVSVYRGWGPARADTTGDSFDSFLARRATTTGAEFHAEQVTRIQLGSGGHTDAEVVTKAQSYSVDFVIGAFGHNHRLFSNIVDARLQPAPLETSKVSRGAVREYEFGGPFVEQHYGNRVQVAVDPTERIWFAALIPKRGIVSIVLMGRDHIQPSDFDDLFAVPALRGLFPSPSGARDFRCACSRSSVTTSSARRFLIPGQGGIALIGDAGPTRPRKNGLFAAIDLAQELASCIEHRGVGRLALRPFNQHAWANYVIDDVWADAMLSLTGNAAGIPILGAMAMRSLARATPTPVVTPAMKEYARLILTGEGPYWRIPIGVLKKVFGV